MIFEKVRQVIADQMRVKDIETITLQTDIITELKADSLDLTEMLMAMEEEYGITIDTDKAIKMRTVGDIVNFISSFVKE